MISQRTARILSRRIQQFSYIGVRHHNFDGEAPSKTHISMIAFEDESHNYITAYSNYGLRLTTGLGVRGPCAVFPRAVLHWNVFSADKITPESLSLFCILEPKLDILVIGKGDWDAKVDDNIFMYLRSRKINVEILPTEQACSTFNYLNAERRVVAAAIIPPKNVPDELSNLSLSELDLEDIHEMELAKMDQELKTFMSQNPLKFTNAFRTGIKSGQSNPGDQDQTKTDDKESPKK